MKVSFEVDARLIAVTTGCGLAGLFALHAAYPGLYDFWPKTSADLASWMQAIGAVVALFLVSLQTSRQIAADRLAREEEHAARVRGVLIRASHLVKELRDLCEKSEPFVVMISIGRMKPQGALEIRDLFEGLSMQLTLMPFWDIPDASLAIELQGVQHAAKLFVVTLDREPQDSAHMLTNLVAACDRTLQALADRQASYP